MKVPMIMPSIYMQMVNQKDLDLVVYLQIPSSAFKGIWMLCELEHDFIAHVRDILNTSLSLT